MQIVDNAALKLQLPPSITNTVLNRIEKSVLVNEGSTKKLLVNWEHEESEMLAACLDSEQPNPTLPNIPSPMLRDYDWPGLYTPFDHQKVTASYVSIRKKAFVFNEAGTGKTSAVIWAADYLMRLGLVKRVLVICPLSIMYSAWRDDIFKTAMHRTSVVAHGERDKRVKIIQGKAEFVIINFDGVNIVTKDIYDARFDLIIVDEANAYKTATTKRWKTLAKLVNTDTRLWMMTGTPASQSPVDAFGLARLVSPNRVPKYVTAWKDKVMYQVSRFKWVPKVDAQKSVFTALQPAIRFTKQECLDLPAVTYQTREVPISAQVAHYYNTLKKQFLIEAAGAQISAVNAAASLSKLLQISGGAVYTDKKDILDFDISPRLNAMMEVVDETVNKVVVFVPYLHTIDPVSQHLRDNGISNEVINGDVSPIKRAEIIGRFQTQDNPRALVIQPQSASHGVTLTRADTMIFWSPVMSVETYIQCIGRIDRVGQKNKMTVVHLQSTEAERKVYTMLRGKVDSHLSLVDLYKQELDEV